MYKNIVRCYEIFIRGLLDITDNIKDHHVISPPDVMAYDGEDPYLVVAADKGTSSFSDIANHISETYDYKVEDKRTKKGYTIINRIDICGEKNLNHWIKTINFSSPKHLEKIKKVARGGFEPPTYAQVF